MIVALFDAMPPFNVTYESETITKRNKHSLADMHARGLSGYRHFLFLRCDPLNEAINHRKCLLRLIKMRTVSAIFQDDGLCRSCYPSFDDPDLSRCTVLIICSLNQEYRHANPRQVLFDIPRSKLWIEPDLIPSPESAIDILSVITLQTLPQIPGAIVFGNTSDAFKSRFFNEDMRCE